MGLRFWCGWCGSLKCFYGSKSQRGSKTMSIFFAFSSLLSYSKCSLQVFLPDIRPFVFLVFISYSNWLLGLKIKLSWINLKQAFFNRFPYLFPEVYLEPTQTSTMQPFQPVMIFVKKLHLSFRLGSKYVTNFHDNNKMSLVV